MPVKGRALVSIEAELYWFDEQSSNMLWPGAYLGSTPDLAPGMEYYAGVGPSRSPANQAFLLPQSSDGL
jgi:hypothetical protein